MKTIFKYELKQTDRQTVEIPWSAKVLHVGEQAGGLFLWALVDPSHHSEEMGIHIFGTGHPFDESAPLIHLATVQMASGLVWHVFEDCAPKKELRS